MSDSRHVLRFGDLILSEGSSGATDSPYWFDVVGDSFTTGNPQPVEVTVFSLLQDSSLTTRVKDDNREASVVVTVNATDTGDLAQGIAALEAQTNRRNELGFTPPDGWSGETVFDVLTSSLEQVEVDFSADFALTKNRMSFRLRLVCKAFARPAATIVSPALVTPAATESVTTISPGDSVSGWMAKYGTLTDAGSYLYITGTKAPQAIWSGSVSISGKPFVSIIAQRIGQSGAGVYGVTDPVLYVNDLPATFVAASGVASAPGWTRYTFQTTVTTATKVLFTCKNFTDYSERLQFYSLTASNVAPFSGTQRQTKRAVPVAGTARTEGSFQVSTATGSLGTVLLYTWNGNESYSPALRQYRTSGPATPTADTSTVSSAYDLLSASTPTVFEVPVANLMDGAHELLVRLQTPTTPGSQVITYTCETVVSGVVVGQARTQTVTLTGIPGSTSWKVFSLGVTDLVSVDLPPNSSAIVRVTLQVAVTNSTRLDEMWVFNIESGDLTWVEAGTATRLWVDTATTERPYPSVMVGTAADRSDAYNAGGVTVTTDAHEFVPPSTQAFIVTTGALAAPAQLEHYPRSRFLIEPS